MTIQRMHHVGIVVDDLAAAIAFFVELGLELRGEWEVEGEPWADRVVGLEGVRAENAILETPDGHARLELVGEVERYEDIYRLCYIRGPERIIVELAGEVGR